MHGYGKVFIEFENHRQILYEGFFIYNILCDWFVVETLINCIINDSNNFDMLKL